MRKLLCFYIGFTVLCSNLLAQAPSKIINHQTQTWLGYIQNIRVNNKWGIAADVHYRTNEIMGSTNFFIIRGGVNYFVNNQLSLGLAYGRMWVAPTVKGFHTYAKENRIISQVQFTSEPYKGVKLTQRLRDEFRWQENIAKDTSLGSYRFSQRFRYQLSAIIPFSSKKNIPSLSVADELSVQFGKEIVNNTFDQNRFFIGLRETLFPRMNVELGYMLLYQQKASGYQYDENNTLRLFVTYSPDLRKK